MRIKERKLFVRAISIGLAIMLCLAMFTGVNVLAAKFSGGSGTKADPYIVKTAKDLDAMRDNLAAHYKLGATIDMSSIKNFEPIGVGIMDENKNNDKDTYILYYHIASSNSLLTTEMGATSSDNKYSIAHVEAYSIYEAFRKITSNSIRNIIITHLQSIIITHDFITIDNLKMLIELVKTYNYIEPSFYIFATNSKLDEIFSIENPENISSFYSIITSNNYITTYDLTYFTEFASSFLEETLVTKIVCIESRNDLWQNEDKPITTLSTNGDIFITNDGRKLFLNSEEYNAIYILNHETKSNIIINNVNYILQNCRLKIIEKDNIFTIKIRGNIYASSLTINNSNEIINKLIEGLEKEFTKIISLSKEQNIDLLNLQDIIYRKYNKKEHFDLQNAHINYDFNFHLLN